MNVCEFSVMPKIVMGIVIKSWKYLISLDINSKCVLRNTYIV